MTLEISLDEKHPETPPTTEELLNRVERERPVSHVTPNWKVEILPTNLSPVKPRTVSEEKEEDKTDG